jgi:hypothetical protein
MSEEVSTSDEFSWSDKESVVVPRQDAIAVYRNSDGNIVIRRQRDWDEEEDSFIIIDRRHGPLVIDAIAKILKEEE